jgi:hypothetical protein
MNVYTAQIHRQRCEVAEQCRLRLLDIERQILAKRGKCIGDVMAYPNSERRSDLDALQRAQADLTAAIGAILEIESD